VRIIRTLKSTKASYVSTLVFLLLFVSITSFNLSSVYYEDSQKRNIQAQLNKVADFCFLQEVYEETKDKICTALLGSISYSLDTSRFDSTKEAFLWQIALESNNILSSSRFVSPKSRQSLFQASEYRLKVFYPKYSIGSIKSIKDLKVLYSKNL